MRLLVTADLHFDHPRSRPLAEQIIAEMNRAGGDALLVVGDTASADADALEQCLSRFRIGGPRLFVAGNHELWTRGGDSYEIITHQLPARLRAMGWQWLQGEPYVAGDVAIVGSVGWYDYSFASPELGIPPRFYAQKISPGAAARFEEFAPLLARQDDIAPHARQLVARWNDGRFVRLGRSDECFLDELLGQLKPQLEALANARMVIAAVHHLPYSELLPPRGGGQWDFARAFLGSARLGELLSRFDNVRQVFCGHSHFPVEKRIGAVSACNIGSGYRVKTFRTLETG